MTTPLTQKVWDEDTFLFMQVRLQNPTHNRTSSKTSLVQKILLYLVSTMMPSGSDRCHGLWLEHTPTKLIDIITDICTWFGVIPSTAQVAGSFAEDKRVLPAWSAHMGVCWWRWGAEYENNGAKVNSQYQYIQQLTRVGGGGGGAKRAATTSTV